MIAPLWQRALDARRREQCNASLRAPRTGHKLGGKKRKHPPAKVGDMFGNREVIAVLPKDSTCNERVRVRCPFGHERDAYVFNLRKHSQCSHCRREGKGPELTWFSPEFTADEIASLLREELIRRGWGGTYRMTARARTVDLGDLPELAAGALKRLRAAEQEVRSA